MPEKELKSLLHKLNSELKNTKNIDESSAEVLNQIKSEIEILLDERNDKIIGRHTNLLERLKIAKEHFEAMHPELTSAINNVINFLNNIGL